MRKLIGICGRAGAGKDTIGDYLVSNYGWEKMSFANALKDITSIIFGWDRKMLAGETPEDRVKREEKDEYWSVIFNENITPRIMLQILGTNILRKNLGKDIWVNVLRRKLIESSNNVVITDVRFPNEIDMIKSLGGEIIRVERGELPSWFRDLEKLQSTTKDLDSLNQYEIFPDLLAIHESEWKWIGYDNPKKILDNNDSFDKLYEQVNEFMKAYM
jgi:hypothetical protein